MSIFCKSSSGMSLTSSRHSSLVASIQCCACSVIRSSRSSGHSSDGWRSEEDAEADNVVGSKSSCGVLVLLSDGAGPVDVVGILIAGVGIDIVGVLTATMGGDTDAAEVNGELLVFLRFCTVLQKSMLRLVWHPKQWRGPFTRSCCSLIMTVVLSGSLLLITIAQRAALVSRFYISSVNFPLPL